MQKDAERVQSDAPGDGVLAGAVHVARPDDRVRNAESLTVLMEDLVLLHFGEAIGIAAELRMRLDRARLVEQSPSRLPRVAVHRERTDADKSLQAIVDPGGVEEITRRPHRLQDRVVDVLTACDPRAV